MSGHLPEANKLKETSREDELSPEFEAGDEALLDRAESLRESALRVLSHLEQPALALRRSPRCHRIPGQM